MRILESFIQVGTIKPECELADVVRLFGAAYRRKYDVSWEQARAMRDIEQCRTAALGGYVEECDECGRLRIRYRSCRNRNCPKCGAYKRAQWLLKQEVKLLPGPYFHVVFTIAHEVNALAELMSCDIYDLLFQTAAATLKKYGKRYLGGEIGFIAALHTWGQTLTRHIHLHCIVTGGALQQTQDGARWRSSAKTFLFPVKQLSREFRERFCAGLLRLHRQGKLKVAAEIMGVDVEGLVKQMRSKAWEVFIKPAPGDPRPLCDYLGKYVQGIAISNYRILSIRDGQVSFTYHDNRDGGKEKVMSLPALEFMRRFLQHVLPSRFVRVRHYGLHHSSKREERETVRRLLGSSEKEPAEAPKLDLGEWLQSFLPEGEDPKQCPFCKEGRMYLRSEFGSLSPLKAGLLSLLGIPLRGAVLG
jgi:hypothetical protein